MVLDHAVLPLDDGSRANVLPSLADLRAILLLPWFLPVMLTIMRCIKKLTAHWCISLVLIKGTLSTGQLIGAASHGDEVVIVNTSAKQSFVSPKPRGKRLSLHSSESSIRSSARVRRAASRVEGSSSGMTKVFESVYSPYALSNISPSTLYYLDHRNY